jgi:hypothetical protein
VPNEKLFAQARDELFSHINRCGVLTATDEDKTVWMDETIDYLGERYPELAKPDLTELHSVGIRFCQPAINNFPTQTAVADPPLEDAEVIADAEVEIAPEVEPVSDGESPTEPTAASDPATSEAENTSDEGDDANAA